MKFKEIEVGKSEQIRALLTGIEERGSKAGTRYLILNFTDGEQTVTANYWNCTREEFTAKEGQVLDLRVDAKLYKGSTSYTVQSYLLTDESPEAYVTSAPMDPVDMFNKIHSFATGLGVYGMLVCTLLEENREKLLTWAAGKSVHHNILGGLLYHMYTMLQSASQLYKVYKNILPLDRQKWSESVQRNWAFRRKRHSFSSICCFPIMEKGKWGQSHCRQFRKHPSCTTLTAWMLRCTCSGQQGKKQNREKCLIRYLL